jgi:hypothetical protein
VGLDVAEVRRRALRAIETTRAPRPRWSRGKAEINEDLIRRALKDEFRADFLRAALAKPTRDEQVTFLRTVTEDLNPADKGNLLEELLAAHDPGLARHAVLDQAALASGRPPVRISKDRVADLVGEDGTLIEVKAVKTKMGREQEEQLRDYLKVMKGEGRVPYNQGTVVAKRLVYAFMEPEGVLANRAFIAEALGERVVIRVYNKAGFTREFIRPMSVDDAISFAMSSHP